VENQFDLIVVGGGPAGYVCAIRAAQQGLKTACVDHWCDEGGNPVLGGTCLNVGCIPSKALLETSELYHKMVHDAGVHGLSASEVKVDVAKMMDRKRQRVGELTGGIEQLFKANGVTWVKGTGQLDGLGKVNVYSKESTRVRHLNGESVVLATGSSPITIDAAPVDHENIVDSTGALAFDAVPKRLVIIGAGVIGLELGSVWQRLGSEVVLLEAQSTFLAVADQDVAKEGLRHFTEQGLDIRLGARVVSTKQTTSGITVHYQVGDEKQWIRCDKVVVAVGRRPNSEGICTAETDLLLDERAFVHVDEMCQTNLPNVYAIGDLVRGPMLAHKGSEEGVMVADLIAGETPVPLDLGHIPSVIYTDPEISWVGLTEAEAKERGKPYNVGTFSFAASGRARVMEKGQGIVKVIADAESDQILGVHMVGPHTSELIAEAVTIMEFGGSSEDLGSIVHAHPTLSEAVKEAAMGVVGSPIHMANRKRK
jgi:dihydrolipoamide dehydrogenase